MRLFVPVLFILAFLTGLVGCISLPTVSDLTSSPNSSGTSTTSTTTNVFVPCTNYGQVNNPCADSKPFFAPPEAWTRQIQWLGGAAPMISHINDGLYFGSPGNGGPYSSSVGLWSSSNPAGYVKTSVTTSPGVN